MVERYSVLLCYTADGKPFATMCPWEDGRFVDAKDYDALAARLAEAERLLLEAETDPHAQLTLSWGERTRAFLRPADSAEPARDFITAWANEPGYPERVELLKAEKARLDREVTGSTVPASEVAK